MIFLSAIPSTKNLFLLFISAFLLRAATFYFYVQHQERYHQADSMDYHINSLSMALGKGMTKLQSGQPTFWRTPGYPLYLSCFFTAFGLTSGAFEANSPAHKASIWVQIFLSSFIPIIIFFLALALTHLINLAWIAAWISVFHLGLILSSTFLLTEGITLVFFYLFLLFFYKSFNAWNEPVTQNHWRYCVLAAVALGIATWIRPMGEFVSVVAVCILALCSQDTWLIKLKKILLFLTVFFSIITPWYIRNYTLTGKVFFCPMFGTYLNAFVAPKIIRETHNIPLEKTWAYLQKTAQQKALEELIIAHNKGKALVSEHAAGMIAWPLVKAHPWITLKVWMPEVFKTTFDLYASQLVAFANNSYTYDPLEEFLFEKIALALYKQSMPLWMRLLCWLEFLFSIALWLSIFVGVYLFWLQPLFLRFNVDHHRKSMASLWFKCAILIGSIVFMTGGFGYARLRLPVEPLLIILALTVWRQKNRE